MNKNRLYWILQITGWSLLTIINLLLVYYQGEISSNYIYYHLLLSTWYLLSTHVFRIIIKKWHWLQIKIKFILPKVFIGIVILSVVNFVVHLLLWLILGALDVDYDLAPKTIGIYLLASFFFYLVWTIIYFTFQYVERYNAALKYEALKNEIELNNLKSQLNPHFIFNSLNSIRALVDEDPDKSKDAITRLSSILRSSLISNRNKLTPFMEEIHAVQDYLDLETIRFEERLQTKFDIDPKSSSFQVPPMMIQTLVENGIKHGISKLKEGGEISLHTEVKENHLNIKIRNNGQLSNKKMNGSRGFGLENTKQRLKLLYGNQATFNIENEDPNTVLTEINLPKKL